MVPRSQKRKENSGRGCGRPRVTELVDGRAELIIPITPVVLGTKGAGRRERVLVQQPPEPPRAPTHLWAHHWGRFLTSKPSWGLHPFTHPSAPAGGVAHGPRGPTSYYYMLPMKVRVQGLKVALTVKLAQVTAPILREPRVLGSGLWG